MGLEGTTQGWESCAQNALFPTSTPAARRSGLTNEQKELVRAAAQTEGVEVKFALALVSAESNGNPNAISLTGCAGLMQICTGSSPNNIIKVQCGQRGFNTPQLCNPDSCDPKKNLCDLCSQRIQNCVQDDRFNPAKNIQAGVRILKQNERFGNLCKDGVDAMKCQWVAYNAGGGIIQKAANAAAKANNEKPTWDEISDQLTRELFKNTPGYTTWDDNQIDTKIKEARSHADRTYAYYLAYK